MLCSSISPPPLHSSGLLNPTAVRDQEQAFLNADPHDLCESLQYEYIPLEARIMMFNQPELLTDAQREAVWLFRYLLVYQSALQSFSHGANDVSNAAGPLLAIFNLHGGGACGGGCDVCVLGSGVVVMCRLCGGGTHVE